jgi:cytosine/adenosine deaminase-related metal-dependent hydrolase
MAADAEVIDARGCVVTPGLVNTHHHLYQTLTRAVPGGQDALLFGWLKTLYPIW